MNFRYYTSILFILSFSSLQAQNPVVLPPVVYTTLSCTDVLQIDEFRHKDKANKVVVSSPSIYEEIKYKAKPGETGTYLWELGDVSNSNYWDIRPLDPTPFDYKGKAFIAYDNLPIANSDFGTTHGDVKVTKNSSETASATAQVYFRSYDENMHDPSVPNWFYYWKNLVQSDLTLPGIKLYDQVTCDLNPTPTPYSFDLNYNNSGVYMWNGGAPGQNITYGTNPNGFKGSLKLKECPPGSGTYVCWELKPSLPIVIGEANGYWNVDDPSTEGIECFYETLKHELHHSNLFFIAFADGYTTALDTDIDGYKDSEEDNYNTTYQSTGRKLFYRGPTDPKDVYTSSYTYQDYLAGTILNAATMYEEDECRSIGRNNKNAKNNYDWSYDPNKKVLGKNWKKK